MARHVGIAAERMADEDGVIAGAVEPTAKGEALGITASLMSASMAIVPVAAGALFEINPSIPYLLSGVVLAGGIFLSRVKTPQAAV